MVKNLFFAALAAALSRHWICESIDLKEGRYPGQQDFRHNGKQMYVSYCAPCHGVDGKGNGPVAAALKKQPADLAVLSKKQRREVSFNARRDGAAVWRGSIHRMARLRCRSGDLCLSLAWIRQCGADVQSAQNQQSEPLSAIVAGEIADRSFGSPSRAYTWEGEPMSEADNPKAAKPRKRRAKSSVPVAAEGGSDCGIRRAVGLRAANPHPPPAPHCAMSATKPAAARSAP